MNESQRLEALREYQILETPPEDAYDDLALLAANICGTPIAAVTLVDAERLWFKSIQGISATEIPRVAAFCAHTILQSDLLIVPDTHGDERFAGNPFVAGNPHFRFYAGAPLLTPEGQALGALCVLDTGPRVLTDSQQTALRVLARQVVSQFELTRVVMSQEKLLIAQEKAAAALRESEARFRQMADAIPHLAWTTVADGSVDYYNQRWYDYTGLIFEETEGRDWSKVIHPEDFEEAATVWRTALRTGKFSEVEYRLRRSDGEFRWYLGRTEPIFDGNGTLVKWVGTATDIEDYKQAEQKRKTSEEDRQRSEEAARLLSEAMANAVDGVIVADPHLPDYPVVYCNPAFLAMTGYAESEVLGRNCRFLQGPETSPAGVHEIWAALKAERGCEVTLRNYKKDGTPFWNNLTLSPVRDAEGGLTHFVGIQHDVTAVMASDQALRETERRLHTVLENMSDAVVALDTQWCYTFVNSQAAQIFRRRPEDMIGKHLWTEFPEVIGQPSSQAYHKALAEQTPLQIEEYDAPDDRWFENRIYPSPEGLSIFFHDITDRKRAEEALRLSEAQFRTIIDVSPIPFCLNDDRQNITFLNAEFIQTFGYTLEDIPTLSDWWPRAYPDSDYCRWVATTWQTRLESAKQSGRAFEELQVTIRCKDGTDKTVMATAAALEESLGGTHLVILYDITERKRHEQELERLNRLYAALSQVSQAIVRMPVRAELFQQVCRVLVEQGGFHIAWIGWNAPESHQLLPVAAWGDQRGYLQSIQIYTDDRPEGRGPAGMAFREERPYICNRIADDPTLLPWRTEIARHGIQAVSVFPIRLKAEVCGTLTVYADEANFFQDKEIALLTEAAADISFALDNLAREDERRRAEEARDRFTAVLDATPDFVGMTDPQGRNLYLNCAARRMLGLAETADVSEISIAQCHPLESARQILTDGIPTALREGVWSGETAVLHRDGGETPISQVIIAHKDVAGTVRFFSTVGRDMTERRRAEEMQLRLAAIVNSSDDAIIGKTLEGIITSWNPGAEKTFGYSAAEAIGQSMLMLFPPERVHEEEDFLTRIGRGENVRHFDTVRVRKGGTKIDISVTLSPITDAHGQVIGASKIARDITERKQAEARIQDLNQTLEKRVAERTVQLEALNRELEAFSYSVSHDLRAPLRSIDGFSQALLEDYTDCFDATGREYLGRVRAASQRMSVLIDDLLQLSRVTRGELRRETVDLSALAAALTEELAQAHPGREVETVIVPGLSANTDPRLMHVVLENLLANAWKYTAKHTAARIEFGQMEQGGRHCFYIRDDGAGFDMAYAGKLFSAFHRLHTPREFEGTGIGLATVQRILQRHGGRIWAEAAVEQGATFYFVLE